MACDVSPVAMFADRSAENYQAVESVTCIGCAAQAPPPGSLLSSSNLQALPVTKSSISGFRLKKQI